METDKPLAGALKAVENHCDHTEPPAHWIEDMDACSECVQLAHDFARESGMAELVSAVDEAEPHPLWAESNWLLIDRRAWQRIIAAARRVREG